MLCNQLFEFVFLWLCGRSFRFALIKWIIRCTQHWFCKNHCGNSSFSRPFFEFFVNEMTCDKFILEISVQIHRDVVLIHVIVYTLRAFSSECTMKLGECQEQFLDSLFSWIFHCCKLLMFSVLCHHARNYISLLSSYRLEVK